MADTEVAVKQNYKRILSDAAIARNKKLAKERYAADPAKKRSVIYAWRKNNPEKYEAIRKASYAKHAEKRRARERQRYWENPEKFRENAKSWNKTNPEAAAAIRRNRKARVKNAEGRHTADDIILILAKQRNLCAYCRSSIKKAYHVDHIMPVCRGGSNWPSNLQLTCPTCNLKKRDADPLEFARRLGRLL